MCALQLAQWLEEGVFDALEKRYLTTFVLAVYAGGATWDKSDLLECYTYNVRVQARAVLLDHGATSDGALRLPTRRPRGFA